MQAKRPRFVLIAESDSSGDRPQWRFALHAVDSSGSVVACDVEPGASEQRLSLMALVRGLESLDQPSDVTLVTRSPSINRGVSRDLASWRNNHWRWERFGRLTPIRDADLWRRVDQAMRFHRLECRLWRLDESITAAVEPRSTGGNSTRSGDTRKTHDAHFVDGLPGSPAIMIVPSERSRRRVRLAARTPALAAG